MKSVQVRSFFWSLFGHFLHSAFFDKKYSFLTEPQFLSKVFLLTECQKRPYFGGPQVLANFSELLFSKDIQFFRVIYF